MTRSVKCSVIASVVTVATLGALAAPALATITTTRTASTVATAIVADTSAISGSSFQSIPPTGGGGEEPNAVSTTPLGGFQTNGTSYGILTTGDATLVNQPNSSGSDGVGLGGPNVRGVNDYDVTILKVDLNVPAGVNCMTVDFRFLSEEYPEFVGSNVNDAFVAELDTSDWTTDAAANVTAPHNFAFDPTGHPITVNAAGAASMTLANAAGTTYDGATPLLNASTPVSSGAHHLYLSIFDQGDDIYDSAVFLDNVRFSNRPTGTCVTGATNGQIMAVVKNGTGSGTVTSSPAGIDCGATCSHSYTQGTVVTLTATPATGSTFAGWSGDCSGTGSCTVTMSQARSVTATFNLVPPVIAVPPSVPASGLFCGVQHRGKCKGIKVKTAFTGPGNAVWQFAAYNPHPGHSTSHAAARRFLTLGQVKRRITRAGTVTIVFKLRKGARTRRLYRIAVKRKLTRLRVKVVFTNASGLRQVKTKTIKLRLRR